MRSLITQRDVHSIAVNIISLSIDINNLSRVHPPERKGSIDSEGILSTVMNYNNYPEQQEVYKMPRLIGKQSNNSWYLGAFALLAIVAASLEYFGVIHLLPNDYRTANPSQSRLRDR